MWLCKRDSSKECEGKYKDCTDCVIDKIRFEIMRLDYIDEDKYEGTSIDPQISRDEVLKIIDKYKAESEE